MKSQSVEPHLGVANGAHDIMPCEGFVAGSVVVGGKAGLNEGSFVIIEKFRRCRVVGNEKVRT